MTERISVVLPAPLRPMTPTNFPVGTSRFTPRRMPTVWMETSSASMRSMFALPVLLSPVTYFAHFRIFSTLAVRHRR